MSSGGSSSNVPPPQAADIETWTPSPMEPSGNKFWIKAKENPFVPLGCLATVFALSFGLVSFKRGNMAMSQNMMRLRVVAQGGTVVALIAGMAMASTNKKR